MSEPSEREEAPRPTGWQSAQVAFDNPRMVKVLFETPECAEAFIDGIEPTVGPIVAATRMRERCVEKVRQVLDGLMIELPPVSDAYLKGQGWNSAIARANNELMPALESLTLDGEKEQ